MTKRERFLHACHCRVVDRPPIWLMRQAGRALPEYRELKEKHTFLEMVQSPELAAEVTLQPIRRFGFDAAILFSDILVIPEAMGQGYHFREQGGIGMEFLLNDAADIDKLDPDRIREKLDYTARALRLIRAQLGEETALLGFAGSPWTLANFMVEGGSAREFTRAKILLYSDRHLFGQLMKKLTKAVLEYLHLQIDAGVDAVQIFDSLGGTLAQNAWEEASGRWINEIIAGLRGRAPVILFARGVHGNWAAQASSGARVIGLDWGVSLAETARVLPSDIALQGNLDPALLQTTPRAVEQEARRLLDEMRGRPGHIFNLGHGVTPGARLDCIEALVNTVQQAS